MQGAARSDSTQVLNNRLTTTQSGKLPINLMTIQSFIILLLRSNECFLLLFKNLPAIELFSFFLFSI